MDCSLGIAAILTLLFLGVIFFCAFRFLKKKRQNKKAEKNKKIAEDEKILIEEAEDIDILEDPIEVGFFFNLMLIKHLFIFNYNYYLSMVWLQCPYFNAI